MSKTISADNFSKLVVMLTELSDRDYKHLIKCSKQFRKAHKSLSQAQDDLIEEHRTKRTNAHGMRYEFQ